MTKFYPVYYNGRETNVEVSKCGQVKRVRKEWSNSKLKGIVDFNLLKLHNKGYLYLSVSIKGLISRHILVHQLIASAFLGYEFGGNLVVDHIDNDKTNNNLSNLQLITQRENIARAFDNGLPYGVHYCPEKRLYRARTTINRKKVSLGYYKDPIEAGKVYSNYVKSLSC